MDGLVVATTVRVVDGIHRHAADRGVLLAARLRLVEGRPRLHQRLLGAAASSQHADAGAAGGGQVLQPTGGQADANPVAHASLEGCVVTAAARQATSVPWS